MEKLYKMSEAAMILGVTVRTLQRWDRAGKLRVERTIGGKRRIPESELHRLTGQGKPPAHNQYKPAIYARVSSHEQKTKGDLARQVASLREWIQHEPILEYVEVGSGLNDHRYHLLKMMRDARKEKITDLYITYKDRLTRFGFTYLKEYFESYGVTIHILHANQPQSTEEELVQDMIAIVTSFSGKLYGKRGKRKDKIITTLKQELEES